MEELSIRNPGAMAATAQRIALEVQRERKARAHGKGDKSKKIPPVGLGSGGNTTALRTMTNFTSRMFVQACVLSGYVLRAAHVGAGRWLTLLRCVADASCDYLESLPRIGLVTALKLVKQYRAASDDRRLERVLRHIHLKGASHRAPCAKPLAQNFRRAPVTCCGRWLFTYAPGTRVAVCRDDVCAGRLLGAVCSSGAVLSPPASVRHGRTASGATHAAARSNPNHPGTVVANNRSQADALLVHARSLAQLPQSPLDRGGCGAGADRQEVHVCAAARGRRNDGAQAVTTAAQRRVR